MFGWDWRSMLVNMVYHVHIRQYRLKDQRIHLCCLRLFRFQWQVGMRLPGHRIEFHWDRRTLFPAKISILAWGGKERWRPYIDGNGFSRTCNRALRHDWKSGKSQRCSGEQHSVGENDNRNVSMDSMPKNQRLWWRVVVKKRLGPQRLVNERLRKCVGGKDDNQLETGSIQLIAVGLSLEFVFLLKAPQSTKGKDAFECKERERE